MKPPNRPRVTIVTPVFREAGNLPRYAEAVTRTLLEHPDFEFQVLFVDDGSPDTSWEFIAMLCQRDTRFKAIRLSRNFGAHIALSAALHRADGDAVAVLACDLQDPPEVILQFLEQWRAGAKIVWGRRRTRADKGWRVAASRLFEGLVRRYALPPSSRFTTGSFLLMDRAVLRCYQQFGEATRITFALVAYTGFSQAVVDYDRAPRLAGRSAWNVKAMVKAAYDTFFAFSRVPFGMMTAVGASLFLFSLPFSVYLLLCYFLGDPKPGWTSIMLVLIMFFGLQFIFMSFLGEYTARIHTEVVRRPLYFISEESPPAGEEAGRAAA